MNDRPHRILSEAEQGDLRPQFNPKALLASNDLPADSSQVERILLDRFFQLARPIADSSQGAGPDAKLHDSGQFFYLIESLERVGCQQLEETLRIILDDFAQLDERSYDELYLWCIVQLSRMDIGHVQTFWPQVFLLDSRHRAAPWRRPPGTRLFEQPYRLTDLVFGFYVISTLHGPVNWSRRSIRQARLRPIRPSLGECLELMILKLPPESQTIVLRALEELAEEEGRPAYQDALGLMRHLHGRRKAESGRRKEQERPSSFR